MDESNTTRLSCKVPEVGNREGEIPFLSSSSKIAPSPFPRTPDLSGKEETGDGIQEEEGEVEFHLLNKFSRCETEPKLKQLTERGEALVGELQKPQQASIRLPATACLSLRLSLSSR